MTDPTPAPRDERPDAKIADLIRSARENTLPAYFSSHRVKSLNVVSEAIQIAEDTLGSTSEIVERLRLAKSDLVRLAAVGKEGLYTVQKPAPSSRKQSPHVTVNTGCLGPVEKVWIQFHPDYIIIRRPESP